MESITVLTTAVMGILMSLAKKSTDRFATEVAQEAFRKAKILFDKLKERWSGDREATASLIRFEENPELYRSVVEDILKEKISEDKSLVDELTTFLGKMKRPELDVVLKMEEANKATGLEAEEILEGLVKVVVEIKKGENIHGVKVDTIGGRKHGKGSKNS